MNNLIRWRMILGRFASQKLSLSLTGEEERMERALDFLYSREYQGRGIWGGQRHGSLDPSQLTVPHWLKEVRKLFPKETIEVIEKHAIDKYRLTELLLDKQILQSLEPNMDLLKMILTFKGQMTKDVLEEARIIIQKIVKELTDILSSYIRRAFSGRLNRFRRSYLKVAQNFNWKGTVQRNLKHFDIQRKKIIPRDLLFFSRIKREVPWDIVLCVDQSGSMTSSVIYSAVMASIFSSLPSIHVKLVVFDTSVVDLSEYVHDPVEILMSVQLGGGTNIGGAVAYCEQLIHNPHKTIFILITDFEEGASPHQLYYICKKLKESGVRMLGLAALNEEAVPYYDREIAENLVSLGMEISALTPKELTEWLKQVIS